MAGGRLHHEKKGASRELPRAISVTDIGGIILMCLGPGLFVLSWGTGSDRETVSVSSRVLIATSEVVFASGIGLYGLRRTFRRLTALNVLLVLGSAVTELALHEWDSLRVLLALSLALSWIFWLWLVVLDQGRAWPKDRAVGGSRIRRSRGQRS